MADKGRLDFDDILRVVARKINQDTEINGLGRALKIPPFAIQREILRNRHGESHMGPLNLLRDWAKRQKSAKMRQTLIDALLKIKRDDILDDCFPEDGADTVTEPTKRNPSPTSGLPMDTTDDSSGQYGAAGQSHPSLSPGAGPSHPPTPPDVPDYVKPIKMECRKKVGVQGDKLVLDSFGIELEIPPRAIDSKAPLDISLRVLTKTYNLGNGDDEMSVCFGVQCLAPDDLVLKRQVTYTIPHCAVITPYLRRCVKAILYTGEGEYTPEAGVKKMSMLSMSEMPGLSGRNGFIITEDVIKLTMDHFSWAIIKFLRSHWPGGVKKMCCRPFKNKDLSKRKNLVILRVHLYNELKGFTELVKSQEWEQEFISAHPEQQVVIQTRNRDLKMTCYLNKTVIGEPAVVSSEQLNGTRICKPFQFDFTDQPDMIAVSLKVGHNKRKERKQVNLLFELDFSTPQKRETAVSQHQEQPQDASSSQTLQTPQRRQEEILEMAGTDEQAFDNILRDVAKRTQNDKQIDDLGGALNIPSYDIEPARVRNKQDTSHMGSLDLLRAWAKTQRSSTRRQTLIDALKKLKRNDILDAYFPEVVADSSGQQGAVGPSHPSSSPHDSSGQQGAVGPSHSSYSPHDSSEQDAAEGQSHPPPSPPDKWQKRTVRPAKSGPVESDREMQYVMWESLVKGNALVIGNANFPQKGELPAAPPRPWADRDINNMKKLLTALGYNVRICQNLSKPGMEETVKEFTEQLEKDKPQSAVVYISSHGNETGIEGFDRNTLPIPDLLQMFSGVLLGKPKVLIIDACWGGGKTRRSKVTASSLSSGASTITFLPENADIFMIHSTSYGKMSWSCTTNGSWLVDELCEVVYNNDRDLEDLDTIMLRVTKGVRGQTGDDNDGEDVGTQSTTVLKQGVDRKLFFYPGFSPTNV